MRSSSRFVKFSGFAVLIGLFMFGSLRSASVDARLASQAMSAATSNAPGPAMPSCPTLDVAAMMSTPQSTMMATSSASSAIAQTGFLSVELAAVDNCGVQVLQEFSGSSAARALQQNDVIVAIDCVALADMINGSVATASASSVNNCMASNMTGASMMGVAGAMSSPACMNTGVAGGTLRVTSLFFCIISQYHAGDTVTLTLWRGDQQMNVPVILDPAPAGTPAATAAAGGGSAATSMTTSPSLTTPTVVLSATPAAGSTGLATP